MSRIIRKNNLPREILGGGGGGGGEVGLEIIDAVLSLRGSTVGSLCSLKQRIYLLAEF